MIREWLLVIWLGTSTNFTLQGVYWSREDCEQSRRQLMSQLNQDFVLVCTQDMREGRSAYPKPLGSQGIAK